MPEGNVMFKYALCPTHLRLSNWNVVTALNSPYEERTK